MSFATKGEGVVDGHVPSEERPKPLFFFQLQAEVARSFESPAPGFGQSFRTAISSGGDRCLTFYHQHEEAANTRPSTANDTPDTVPEIKADRRWSNPSIPSAAVEPTLLNRRWPCRPVGAEVWKLVARAKAPAQTWPAST